MASKRTRAASFDDTADDASSSDELLTDAVSEEVAEAAPVRHAPATRKVASSPTPEIVSKPSAGEAAASLKRKNPSRAAKVPASLLPEREHVAGDPTQASPGSPARDAVADVAAAAASPPLAAVASPVRKEKRKRRTPQPTPLQADAVDKIASAAGADKEVAADKIAKKRTEPSGGKDKRRKKRKKKSSSARAPLPETAGGNAEESPEHAHAGNASPPKEKQQQPEDAVPAPAPAASTKGEKTSSDKALLLQQAETADGDGEESPVHAHAGNASLPKEKENLQQPQPQPEEDAAAARAVVVLPQNKDALPNKGENNALATKGRERSWSQGDELRILTALVKHAKSHGGAMRDPADLFADLAGTFDKVDANVDKLNDKVRKLRARYHKMCSQGCPADPIGRKLFKLSKVLWSKSDEGEKTEATATRDFSKLSLLYPHLAREVRRCTSTSNSGELIMSSFGTIGDDEARDLDARCKKQGIDMLKLEVDQADMTKEVLSALAARMN